MMFDDAGLRSRLGRLFSAKTERFDELVAAAGLNPKTDLVGADLRGADFAGSILIGWDLSRCELGGASFRGAKIRDLKTEGAVGVDLTGAVPLDDDEKLDAVEPSDELESIIGKIRSGTTGSERGPFIESLLTNHVSEERTWAFLLGEHIQRERVGRIVSLIISVWERRQVRPDIAGNELRRELLSQPGGNPYVTVKARLLRELASRVGRSDHLLKICKELIEREGYLTTGNVALKVLADFFRGDDQVRSYLRELITSDAWSGFKHQLVPTLMVGFDTDGVRHEIERAILDPSLAMYERTGMIDAYYRSKNDDPEVLKFVQRIFRTSSEPEIRAAAIRARRDDWNKLTNDDIAGLRSIAASDDDAIIRSAALAVVGRKKDQLDMVIDLAGRDASERIRTLAVKLAISHGFAEWNWYADTFAHDPDAGVRSVALEWLIDEGANHSELKLLLMHEIGRQEPAYVSARAAVEALTRWPEDVTVRHSVEALIGRLSQDMNWWRSYLASLLKGTRFDERRKQD
jgi:hypothetical protein